MPYLTPIYITDQETGPLVAFYDRMAAQLFNLAEHGCML